MDNIEIQNHLESDFLAVSFGKRAFLAPPNDHLEVVRRSLRWCQMDGYTGCHEWQPLRVCLNTTRVFKGAGNFFSILFNSIKLYNASFFLDSFFQYSIIVLNMCCVVLAQNKNVEFATELLDWKPSCIKFSTRIFKTKWLSGC